MSDAEDNRFDAFQLLGEQAPHLNGIRGRWPVRPPFYEILSGAIIWKDETTRSTPIKVIWALRYIWNHRTRIILNEPSDELKTKLWQFGIAHFPNWSGFRPERRIPTPTLLDIYRKGQVGVRKCLRDFD